MTTSPPPPEKFYVLTGCIAKDLLDRNSYVQRPGQTLSREQEKELTRSYANLMAVRIKGKPLQTEHMDELGSVGEVLHSRVDENDGWMIQALIDNSSMRGNALIQAIMEGNATELSLGHDVGLRPAEVSVVQKGARSQTFIHKVEEVNMDRLRQIKDQTYIPSIKLPAGYTSNALNEQPIPRIRCSWDSNRDSTTAMNLSHTALRAPAAKPSYLGGGGVTGSLGSEDRKFVDGLTSGMMNQQQQQPPPKPSRYQLEHQMHQQAQASTDMHVSSLVARIALLEKAAAGSSQPAAAGPPMTYAQQSHAELMQKLSTGSDAQGQPLGNVDTMYSSPAHDPKNISGNPSYLPQMMGVVNNSSNQLPSDTVDAFRSMIQGEAVNNAGMQDKVKALEAQLNEARSSASAMKSKLDAADADKELTRAQTAAWFGQVIKASGGDPDSDTLRAFETEMVQGNSDNAFKIMQGQMIKCSARLQMAQEQRYSQSQAQQVSNELETGESYMNQLMTTLHPGFGNNNSGMHTGHQQLQNLPRVNASSKRGHSQVSHSVNDADTSSSLSDEAIAANSWCNSGVPDSLRNIFAKVDKGASTTQIVDLPERLKRPRA